MAHDKHSDKRTKVANVLEGESGYLYGFALKLTKHHDDALDLVQEASYSALTKAAQLKSSKQTLVRSWVCSIIRNTYIDGLRERKK